MWVKVSGRKPAALQRLLSPHRSRTSRLGLTQGHLRPGCLFAALSGKVRLQQAWVSAHLPRRRPILSPSRALLPQGQCLVSWEGAGTRAGPEPLLPSLGVTNQNPGWGGTDRGAERYKTRAGELARRASQPGLRNRASWGTRWPESLRVPDRLGLCNGTQRALRDGARVPGAPAAAPTAAPGCCARGGQGPVLLPGSQRGQGRERFSWTPWLSWPERIPRS